MFTVYTHDIRFGPIGYIALELQCCCFYLTMFVTAVIQYACVHVIAAAVIITKNFFGLCIF